MFIQGFISATLKSRTIDEIDFHLKSGYEYLTEGEWKTGINNPPLTATLSAIPLLFVKNQSVLNNFQRVRQIDYLYEAKKPFPKTLLLISRLIPLSFMILLGLFVFLWAKELYGAKAGLFALFLYSFSPNMISFGRLITADIGGALFLFASMYAFWKFIRNPTKLNLLFASVMFGLAQVTKLLAILLIPIFIFYCIVIYFLKDFKVSFFPSNNNIQIKKIIDLALPLIIIFSVGILTINSTYMFEESFTQLKSYDFEELQSSTFKNMYENKIVNWIPIPFPKQYVLGHDLAQWAAKDEEREYFFLGVVKNKFKSYFIIHLLIKTPLPIFLFLILGFILIRKITLADLFIFSFITLLLFGLTFLSQLLIGYRHIISIYPLMFVLSSKILSNNINLKRYWKIIIIILAGWYLLSSLFIFPHYLAYFNEFIGGPKNGYKYTVDSNLDWEQDLDLVKKYIKNSDDPIMVDPKCQFIDGKIVIPTITGKVLIPANSLQFQQMLCYEELKKRFEPVGHIGYSWLLYDIRGKLETNESGTVFKKE
tara:strand:- start:1647 stop:3260 length:1614 start_codon:yes stop_codon:yes gene_type:complete